MPENFFNKIKKSFNSFIGISEDNQISSELNQAVNQSNDIKISDNPIVDTEIAISDDLIVYVKDTETEIKSEALAVEKVLRFDINQDYVNFLNNFFQNDSEIISCVIFDKENLNVQAIYSKTQLDKDYIVFLLNDVSNILVNNKINNLVKCEHIDSLIDKLLIVRVNHYQYISVVDNIIIVVITNQKNQLITWKNIDKIKEYILS